MKTQNPFFDALTEFDGAIPFAKYKTQDYLPAVHSAIELAKGRLQKIKDAPASFENTVLALETGSEELDRVVGVYQNLFSAEASEAHQALAKEIFPVVTTYSSDITLDPVLFQKIEEVHQNRHNSKLNPEQIALVEKFYKDFARNGAKLAPADKEKLRAIDQELSVLAPQFSEHVLKASNAYELLIEDKAQLAGLPDGAIEAAAASATQKGHANKWLFSLQAPSYIPFMQYSNQRELRKQLWTAFNSRAFNGEFDNQTIIKKIVKLKYDRANLLGYATYAEFLLAERMAQSPSTVLQFLNKLLEPSLRAAHKDLAELKTYAKDNSGPTDLMPWDFSFYSEKLKEEKFAFNEEELRPYFQLEKVVDGVFEHAKKLYGLQFREVFDVPKYHPDVRTFIVEESKAGAAHYVGLFYADFFPRETKKDGAWMTAFREQGYMDGKVQRPHISIVCNFTKPTATKPSLLSYDEVLTLFHEFGHALHGLLSNCTYKSISGTNVYWDFVELPSQIMENWVKQKEGLDIFAQHYETGEKIPSTLIDKIKRANRFQAGYYSVRQISFGLLDMAWYNVDPAKMAESVTDIENQALEKVQLLPEIDGTNKSCSFSHIFAGGYGAGYYSYKWAEVLDADAFEYFMQEGIFNSGVAQKFREHVLSKGGTKHPMDLYKEFRGREPDPMALLRRDGLIEPSGV